MAGMLSPCSDNSRTIRGDIGSRTSDLHCRGVARLTRVSTDGPLAISPSYVRAVSTAPAARIDTARLISGSSQLTV